jgi:hypothetical protein
MPKNFLEIIIILIHLDTTCINPCKKVLVLKSKRVFVKVPHKIYSEPGLEPEPQFGSARLLTILEFASLVVSHHAGMLFMYDVSFSVFPRFYVQFGKVPFFKFGRELPIHP